MTEAQDIIRKMVVIGDAAVGKTSLIRRFVHGKYNNKYMNTIGTNTYKKALTINSDDADVNLTFMIWDILGHKSFGKLQKHAYNGSKCALLVLDLTRRETLYSFDLWLYSLYEVTGEIPVVVLANKNDLKPEFGRNKIEELVENYGFPYYTTSAKTGENVDAAFYSLGEMIIKPWEGVKIKPMLELSKVFKSEIEIESKEKLTALGVEDMIMARFCEFLDDSELAMDIIRESIQKSGMDFTNPTADELARVLDDIINAVPERVDPSLLEKEKRDYMDLINRIDQGAV